MAAGAGFQALGLAGLRVSDFGFWSLDLWVSALGF
jgi:hypothetical protein